MDEDNFEIDPAIAASMGFSGFGNQNKKRKYDRHDGAAFIDPSITAKSQQMSCGTGANSVAPAASKSMRTLQGPNDEERSPAGISSSIEVPRPSQETGSSTLGRPATAGEPSLEALRHGVRNADGDMVFFKPSFLEDPWRDLR